MVFNSGFKGLIYQSDYMKTDGTDAKATCLITSNKVCAWMHTTRNTTKTEYLNVWRPRQAHFWRGN